MMNVERPFHTQLPISVKTYDVDFANIVHNMVYIRWLEDLRLQILEAYYPVDEMLADGIGPILIKTEIEYKQPIRMGDQVIGQLWISDLSRVRLTMQAEILVNDQIAAQATQVCLFVDMKSFRPIRIPKRLQAQWSKSAKL